MKKVKIGTNLFSKISIKVGKYFPGAYKQGFVKYHQYDCSVNLTL